MALATNNKFFHPILMNITHPYSDRYNERIGAITRQNT